MASNAKVARVALLGFGTVGQSVARILCSGEVPQRPADAHLQPPGRAKARRLGAVVGRWTESVDEVLASDVDIVIELVGGLRPAYDWVQAARLPPASRS